MPILDRLLPAPLIHQHQPSVFHPDEGKLVQSLSLGEVGGVKAGDQHLTPAASHQEEVLGSARSLGREPRTEGLGRGFLPPFASQSL